MTLTAKHAQLLKSNRALLLAFEGLPQVAKLSAVGLALTLGVYGGAMALKGTASDRVQICIRNKQALRCQDNSGKPYLMTRYHAEQWLANGIKSEVVFQKSIPATNPHKAIWMLLSSCGFAVAGVGFRSLQNTERQLANYEAIAEKRDLAKGEMSARAELLESLRPVAIGEVHLQADLEAVANDRAVVLKQCEVLGEADIKIAAMDAEEAVFDAETAGLSDEKKREYMDFLRAQKTPFLLNGTQSLDSINNPSDKVTDEQSAAIESDTLNKHAYINGFVSSTCLCWGNQGGGKSWFVRHLVCEKLRLGYRVIAFDPNSNQAAWKGVELYNSYAEIERMMRWYVKEVEERYEAFCASTITEEQWRKELWEQGQATSVICEEATTYADFIKDEELLARFFRCGGTLSRKPEMPLTIVAHNNTQFCLGNVKSLGNLIRRMQQIQLIATTDKSGKTSQPIASGKALIKMDGSDEWVEVEVPKIESKITDFRGFQVQKTASKTSEKPPISDSEYLERAWGMEFDLDKKPNQDSPAGDDDDSISPASDGLPYGSQGKVSGFCWTVRRCHEFYPENTPEQLFESVSVAAESGESVRNIIKNILKCREGNEHKNRSYSQHGKTLLRWLIANYDNGSIAALPEIHKFLNAE